MRAILDNAVLVGERVFLRPHDPADAGRAFELVHQRDPVLRWLLWQGPERVEELADFYRAWRVGDDQADDYYFAVCRREDDALVGSLGLRFVGHPQTGDVGYWIGEPYWGRGYASEAVMLAAHLAFEHLGAHALTAWVFVGNDPSRRVLEKAGFRYVTTATRRHPATGVDQPEWNLSLLRSDWEARDPSWIPTHQAVAVVR